MHWSLALHLRSGVALRTKNLPEKQLCDPGFQE
jgi:hypothetical protein